MKDKKMARISSNSESGVILPIVLILMLALTITGLAFLNAGVMENSLVRRQIHKNQAFYLAEAGVEATIWQFNYGDLPWPDPPWTEENGDVTRGPEVLDDLQDNSVGDYKVTVERKDESDPRIISTGYVPSKEAEGKMEKTVHVTLEKPPDQVFFDYAIASAAGIIAEIPGTEITGDCYTIGDITIEAATVNGDAVATGTVSVTNEGTVTGTITEGADELPFPEFDSGYYQYKATQIINSDLRISNVDPYPINGIWYVTGNVTISNSRLVGPGSIVAEGTIRVQENSQVGTSLETGVSLISAYQGVEDAIKIEGGEGSPSKVWGMLWAPNGKIKIEQHSTIYGATVSGGECKIETESDTIYHRQFEWDFYSYVTRPVYLVQLWEEQ